MKNLSLTLIALTIMTLTTACSVVGPGERGVRVTMGAASDDIKPSGAYVWVPGITDVRKISVQTQRSDIDADAVSRDQQKITTLVAVNWSVNTEQVVNTVKNFGNEELLLEKIIMPAVNEVIKQATAKKSLDEVLSKREELKSEIDKELQIRLKKYGVEVKDVSIVNIKFSPDYEKSVERKQIAEQDAKKAEYDALKAEQEAAAVVNKAKGDAEAQKLLKATITEEILRLRAIERWDGALPQVVGSGSLPMLNIKAQAVSK